MCEGECKLLFLLCYPQCPGFITLGGKNFPEGIIKLPCTCLEVVVPSLLISHCTMLTVGPNFFVLCRPAAMKTLLRFSLQKLYLLSLICGAPKIGPRFHFSGVKSRRPSDVR